MAALVGAAVLLLFPPERYGFYPRCPFNDAFGLLCPGCGATRAAAALLHGRLMEAWHWNALFVVAVVSVALFGVFERRGRLPGWVGMASTTVAVVFGVFRNLG